MLITLSCCLRIKVQIYIICVQKNKLNEDKRLKEISKASFKAF